MTIKFLFYTFFITYIAAQDNINAAVNSIFTTPKSRNDDSIDGLVEVTPPTDRGDLRSIEKCGEGSDQGVHVCVAYYKCDPQTRVVIENTVIHGFGIIDISTYSRFGEDKPCTNSYLDVCCQVANGTSRPTPSTPIDPDVGTLPPPYTGRPEGTPPVSLPTTPRTPLSFCGIRNDYGIDFKIAGNKDNEAEYGEFPWMTAIIRKGRESEFLCGGSIITPKVVLTGAHCVYNYSASGIKVRAGEWDTQTTKERLPYQERNVKTVIYHEKFEEGTLLNDIALLILQEGFVKEQHLGTICLPTQGRVISSKDCYVTGWGKDIFGKKGRRQAILKKIKLPTVPRGSCEQAFKKTRLGTYFQLHESFLCAGGETGKDACTGDGGGPLVCPDPYNPDRYVQAGIVAWGIGCGTEGVPGAYTDVSKFRQWIDRHMERLAIDTLPYNN